MPLAYKQDQAFYSEVATMPLAYKLDQVFYSEVATMSLAYKQDQVHLFRSSNYATGL